MLRGGEKRGPRSAQSPGFGKDFFKGGSRGSLTNTDLVYSQSRFPHARTRGRGIVTAGTPRHSCPSPSHTTSLVPIHETTTFPVCAELALTLRAGSYIA